MTLPPTPATTPEPAPATTRLPRLPRLPGLKGRGDVELVDLYTRGSLHVIFWFLLAMGVLSSVASVDGATDRALAVVAALAVGLPAVRVLKAAFALYPATAPLPWRTMTPVLVLAAVVAGWLLGLDGDEAFTPGIVLVGTLAWGFGGLRDRRVTWALVGGGALVLGVLAGSLGAAAYGAFLGAFFAFTVQSSLWLLGVVVELDRARGSQAALAVAEERLRFSRDVHDVMGRHLSTIAVQAELAATLAERGDERAPALVREVRGTAHEALREARELARGYRPLDLHQELEGAVALLRSASIDATADLDGLPDAWHPPVARLVREAVTNVLRHSRATWVRIGYDGSVVEVRNDGVGGTGDGDGTGDGTGLATLAAELETLGARLTHGAEGGEFAVRLRLAEEGR